MPRKPPPLAPVRGSHCRDWWDTPDLDEIEVIRAQAEAFAAQTVAIAATLQRDERRERTRRERDRRRG